MNLHSPVTDLKGIGEKTAVPFAKAGIHTVQDLIEYYPRAYELFEEPTEPEEMEDGKTTKSDCMNCGACIVNQLDGIYCHINHERIW